MAYPVTGNVNDKKQNTGGALARHTIVYGLGSAITAAGGFVLIPLYTNTLATDEYGLLEILNRLADIVVLLAFLGTRQAYIRFFFDRKDEQWHKTVTSTTLSFTLAMSMVVLLLGGLTYHIAPTLFDVDGTTPLLFLCLAGWVPFEVLFNVSLTYLRVKVKSGLFVLVNAGRLLLFVGFNVLFLYFLEWGVTGIFASQLIVTGAIGAAFLVYFAGWSGFRVDFALLKGLVAFGLPYLPAAGFVYVISNADRFFLNSFYSLGTVGLFALGSKIGTIGMSLFMRPFEMVWSPYVFAVHDDEEGSRKIGSAFTVYSALCGYIALGVSLAGPIIIRVIAEEQYQPASVIVPIVALGALFYGMATLIDAGVLIAKQTRYKPFIFGVAAAGGLIFHCLLTIPYGMVGASIATALTFLLLFLVNYRISERFYHIELFYRDFVALFIATIGLFLIMRPLVDSAPNLLAEILFLMLAAVSYPIVFFLLSQFSTQDIAEFIADVRGSTNRKR